jgi:hypothetical protein
VHHLKCPDGGIDARDFGARTTLNQTRVRTSPAGGRTLGPEFSPRQTLPPFAILTLLFPAIPKIFPAIPKTFPAIPKNSPCSLSRENSFQSLEIIRTFDSQQDRLSLQFLKISLQIANCREDPKAREQFGRYGR